MGRRGHARVFAAIALALVLLHLWHFPGAVAVPGWMPWDLAYHLLWMLAATGAIFYLTAKVWPEAD
jgi:hypothetical protein